MFAKDLSISILVNYMQTRLKNPYAELPEVSGPLILAFLNSLKVTDG